MTTKNGFFSKDYNYKFLWYLLGVVVVGILTSAANKIDSIANNAKLGKQAYEQNLQQDIKLVNHEDRIVELEKVSVIIIERLDNVCDGLKQVNNRLDNIDYKISR